MNDLLKPYQSNYLSMSTLRSYCKINYSRIHSVRAILQQLLDHTKSILRFDLIYLSEGKQTFSPIFPM